MGSACAPGWFAMLRALVQFESWDSILAGEMLPVLARPRQEAWRHWARALAFANTGRRTKHAKNWRNSTTRSATTAPGPSGPTPLN